MRALRLLILILMLEVGGCASIVGEDNQIIGINSTPDQADFLITDEQGTNVYRGRTPQTVNLTKARGYFGGKDYSIKFTKPGYNTQVVTITSGPNMWYLAGNLLFGGIIGWFLVDPFTGSMYTLEPEGVNVALTPNKAATQGGYTYQPQQGYPTESYPTQGYPTQQGYPSQGYPTQQGYPSQGYPTQQGYPSQGYPTQQGYPSQGYPTQQGYPSQGYPAQQGYPSRGYPAQQGYPSQGYPTQQEKTSP